MKKIFLILEAVLALSSVAFAKPYGEKSRPDSVGDIVFADGTATAWREGLTLTEEQKKAAVAVIFYAGTGCSNGGERRVLGVGLENATDKNYKFAWTVLFSPSKLDGLGMTIESILCAPIDDERLAATATFTGDLDGSDNSGSLRSGGRRGNEREIPCVEMGECLRQEQRAFGRVCARLVSPHGCGTFYAVQGKGHCECRA